MKLEVGNTYTDGYGNRWLIVANHSSAVCGEYTFIGASTNYSAVDRFNEGGRKRGFVCESDHLRPKKTVKWLNVYPREGGGLFNTREEADLYPGYASRIACVRVEFEEGEGL